MTNPRAKKPRGLLPTRLNTPCHQLNILNIEQVQFITGKILPAAKAFFALYTSDLGL
jgi:hypothetical protein